MTSDRSTTLSEIQALKMFNDGFMAAVKLAWYHAETTLAEMNCDHDKEMMKRFIERIKS